MFSHGRTRLVDAAIPLLAESGIAATSLRAVAAAAGVSPGLVAHHFGSKAGLQRAVDETVVRLLRDAYEASEPSLDGRARATAGVFAARPEVCDYVGRALSENTPAAAELFQGLVALGRDEVERLRSAGAIREDADDVWFVLQHMLLLFGPFVLRTHVESTLSASLFAPAQFARWERANRGLLEHGWYVPDPRGQEAR